MATDEDHILTIGGLDALTDVYDRRFADESHTHDASDVASGTLDAARVPSLPASKIGSGTLALARGGTGASTAAAALKALFAGVKEMAVSSTEIAAGSNVSVGNPGSSALALGVRFSGTGFASLSWTQHSGGAVWIRNNHPSTNVTASATVYYVEV